MSLLKGCVLHVRLDEAGYNPATRRVTDLSAECNHGTAVNAAVFAADRMGQVGRATVFNGSSDYIDCGDVDLLYDATISFWLNLAETPSGNAMLVDKYSGVYGYSIFVRPDGTFNLRFGAADAVDYIDTGIVNTTWNHIVLTRKAGDTLKLYANGVIKSNTSAGVDSAETGNGLYIGCRGGAGSFAKVSMADLWIHNRVLDESERSLLFESYRR